MDRAEDLLSQLRIERPPPVPPARSRRLLVWVAVVFALLMLALLVWLVPAKVVPVRVAEISAQTGGASRRASVLDATGYVTARRQATVSAKITGKVAQVLIEEGQRVADGEVVAVLEQTEALAQRALSAAQLDAARSEVERVRAQLRLAEKTLTRNRELVDARLIAPSALDQALADHDALVAQLQSAQRNVTVAERSLALADIGVDNTIVRAPFAGVITVKAAQPGEIISPVSAGGGFTRTGIGTIVDMDSLEVQVDVNEAFIGRVAPGQPVEAVLNAYPDWRIPAEVIAIIPTAERSKATVKVRIALGVRDARIVPDMGVRVSFLEDTPTQVARNVLQVPAAAVIERDGGSVVFVARDGIARLRAVQVDAAANGMQRVRRGLTIGEVVVLDPPPTLADGDRIEITN